jgi:predicted nucleic acid-binding protein
VKVSYLDTSAAFKLVVAEAESTALGKVVDAEDERQLYSSMLLHTELYCALGRAAQGVAPTAIQSLLNRITLVELGRRDLVDAGTRAPLRAHDAIHLAVAIRIGADEILTYDSELAAASQRAGIEVVSPS